VKNKIELNKIEYLSFNCRSWISSLCSRCVWRTLDNDWIKITLDDLSINVDIHLQLYYNNESTMSIVWYNMRGPNTLKFTYT